MTEWPKMRYEEARAFCDARFASTVFPLLSIGLTVYNNKAVAQYYRRQRAPRLKFLDDGDRVWVLVPRVSSSHSAKYEFVNKSHGYVLSLCSVGVQDDGYRALDILHSTSQLLYDLLRRPIGHEKFYQNLGRPKPIGLAVL